MRVLGGVVAIGVWGALAMVPAGGLAEGAGACAIHSPDAATLPSSACVACHDSARAGAHAHPVDVSYASAQAGKSAELRAPSEVAQRGIRLPDGELRCATCHDGASPWAHYLALPPGAEVRAAFDSRALGAGEEAPEKAPVPGDAVSAKPLCLGCHAF
jgi:cytochrome c7-like protein